MFTVVFIGMLQMSIIACGKQDSVTEGSIAEENIAEESVTKEQSVADETETISETQQEDVKKEEVGQMEREATAEMAEQEEAEREGTEQEDTKQEDAPVYEDNFSVEQKEVIAFAGKIKETVANQDLEALADLVCYPLYVGFSDGGLSVMSRDELTALGVEKIFTAEMMDSIENADESTLSPSMAGFALSANGKPNIVFGVENGKLAIKGMNY